MMHFVAVAIDEERRFPIDLDLDGFDELGALDLAPDFKAAIAAVLLNKSSTIPPRGPVAAIRTPGNSPALQAGGPQPNDATLGPHWDEVRWTAYRGAADVLACHAFAGCAGPRRLISLAAEGVRMSSMLLPLAPCGAKVHRRAALTFFCNRCAPQRLGVQTDAPPISTHSYWTRCQPCGRHLGIVGRVIRRILLQGGPLPVRPRRFRRGNFADYRAVSATRSGSPDLPAHGLIGDSFVP
jgi:hypothetical protein